MYLYEIFQNDFETDDKTVERLRSTVLDLLTPLVANHVPFVSIRDIARKLQLQRTGIVIDKNLIKKILDPEHVKFVSKIEDDRVYLGDDESKENIENNDADAEQKEKEEVSKKAQGQAAKNIKNDKGPLG